MAQQMTDGYTFNRVKFTANEETCILKFLTEAQNRDLIKDKEWQFMLDQGIKDNFKNNKISFNKNLSFSITRYNDPHRLENFLNLSMEQLIKEDVKIPLKSQIELDSDALSVYTVKRLETYYHEVIQ